MVWRTMKEWNHKGKMVKKGEKCLLRDPSGAYLFNSDQVKQLKSRKSHAEDVTYSGKYPAKTSGIYHKHDYDYDNWDFQ